MRRASNPGLLGREVFASDAGLGGKRGEYATDGCTTKKVEGGRRRRARANREPFPIVKRIGDQAGAGTGAGRGRPAMTILKKLFGLKSEPVKRVRICVECGMPVAEHKDWCSIFRTMQALEQRKVVPPASPAPSEG